ncbi:transposase [Xanthobacter sp. AM11]
MPKLRRAGPQEGRIARTGMAWGLLPHDPPPSQTVYYYLRRWQREGV